MAAFVLFQIAWLLLLHLQRIFCSKSALLLFFQTLFTKRYQRWHGYSNAKTKFLAAHIQRLKLFSVPVKAVSMPPRDKGRVARVPTSATVKTNSLRSLQGQKRKEKRANTFHTNSAEFQSFAATPAQGRTKVH